MANAVSATAVAVRPPSVREALWVRVGLIGAACAVLTLFLLLPLATVFGEALSKGVDAYFKALADDDALAAIRLTLTVAGIAVPLNVVFGVAAAWCIAKFEFPGKSMSDRR